jgi:predicted Zn-dependent peptidase
MATTTGRVTTFERQTLPNGVRLLTAPMANVQSTSCFLMFAAGSRYETAESNGIAHFAEHMFFKGTERRPTARHIAGEIDSIGGEFNAFTGKEYTGYYVRCAAEHAPVAFDVLVDMIRHSRFDPDEIEREKGVIVEEMNMYFDTPRDYLSALYEQLVYGDGARRDERDLLGVPRPLVQADTPGRRRRREARRRSACTRRGARCRIRAR